MWKPPCRTPGPDFPPPPWSTPSATYSGYGPGEGSVRLKFWWISFRSFSTSVQRSSLAIAGAIAGTAACVNRSCSSFAPHILTARFFDEK